LIDPIIKKLINLFFQIITFEQEMLALESRSKAQNTQILA